MISKPIFVTLAVLVACAIAKNYGAVQYDEKQYKELLAAGMKRDFVNMIEKHDINFDKAVIAAKGNATLIKKLDDEYYIGVQALADSFPVKDAKILYAWFEKNPQKL